MLTQSSSAPCYLLNTKPYNQLKLNTKPPKHAGTKTSPPHPPAPLHPGHLRHKLSRRDIMCHQYGHQVAVEHKVQHGRPGSSQAAERAAGEVDVDEMLQVRLAGQRDAQLLPAGV